ncbi:member of major facilitator multidrug-resistance DHA1 sub-family [Thelephora terrestris]|uniref:Member of major facilitator multidrug-resistance DHA1 sub-family n=1 Tax=Thelephora terrestris TaxID=56493 RepID=A0A9P6LAR9_9AGAM|nr:member of major facilitator multidrug-resistance DHA1 sub-family [Thelephora terrestris]
MPLTIPTGPDEETPLLGGRQVSDVRSISEQDSEAATLAGPSNRGSRTSSIKGKANANLAPEVVKKTPVPWAQFSIVMFLQLAEPLTSQVIYPFAPELIRSLDVAKNDAEVGYYVGIMQSLFFATQACTVLHWSRLSDHIGRKPVILMGLFGLSLSMYCFALSKTFWGLVFSRALNGALNGNIGVIKSIVAEMTDHTNLALALSYQPIAWSTGVTLGPIIGGSLSRPAERFPHLFGNSKFLKEYPYFLPCAVPATFTVVAWLVTFFFLKETHPSAKPVREFFCGDKKRVASEEDPLFAQPQNELEKPIPLRGLLTRDVLVSAANYAFLALIDISFRALQPVFLSTPVKLGGLGLDPPAIGTVMSSFGVLSGVYTVFFFSRMTDYFGAKGVYLIGMTAAVPCFTLFPIINHLARNSVERSGGLGVEVWIAVGAQVVLSVVLCLSYGAVFIFITAAAPNKASLGATNGLAQLSVSILRAVGPALASSMYSLSIDEEHHYMNGGLVYYVTVLLSFGGIWVGSLLPKRPFREMK